MVFLFTELGSNYIFNYQRLHFKIPYKSLFLSWLKYKVLSTSDFLTDISKENYRNALLPITSAAHCHFQHLIKRSQKSFYFNIFNLLFWN